MDAVCGHPHLHAEEASKVAQQQHVGVDVDAAVRVQHEQPEEVGVCPRTAVGRAGHPRADRCGQHLRQRRGLERRHRVVAPKAHVRRCGERLDQRFVAQVLRRPDPQLGASEVLCGEKAANQPHGVRVQRPQRRPVDVEDGAPTAVAMAAAAAAAAKGRAPRRDGARDGEARVKVPIDERVRLLRDVDHARSARVAAAAAAAAAFSVALGRDGGGARELIRPIRVCRRAAAKGGARVDRPPVVAQPRLPARIGPSVATAAVVQRKRRPARAHLHRAV
eukprot:930538-Prymnesium_polylepis.2